MLSLKLLDSDSFIINCVDNSSLDKGYDSLTFERDQLDIFIRSCLNQKKNVLFIKNESSKQDIDDILKVCYANKEKVQHHDGFSFLPHRLKKQKLFNL